MNDFGQSNMSFNMYCHNFSFVEKVTLVNYIYPKKPCNMSSINYIIVLKYISNEIYGSRSEN